MTLRTIDHRRDPAAWAQDLAISKEAVDLYLDCEVIDLHIDSFIWDRVFGYDLSRRHGTGALGARFYSQVDFPRILDAQVGGATWVITTNPFLPGAKNRARLFKRNLRLLKQRLTDAGEDFALVTSTAQYRAARAEGKHGAFIGIQGGNALDAPGALDDLDDTILRITVVHLSNSSLGTTSAPVKGQDRGLTDRGRDFVRGLNHKKIFVDLAHVSPKGFWDALEVHDRSQPVLVTHTGVKGAFEHWRNLDDEQLRAVADLGGTVGVMYQSSFLGDPFMGGEAKSIVDHLDHIIDTVGEDHASLGSDWDGAICPPRDMATCLELPRLVQLMLARGWSDTRIRKILGENFLRVVEQLRG